MGMVASRLFSRGRLCGACEGALRKYKSHLKFFLKLCLSVQCPCFMVAWGEEGVVSSAFDLFAFFLFNRLQYCFSLASNIGKF